jgi:hypothetical protein
MEVFFGNNWSKKPVRDTYGIDLIRNAKKEKLVQTDFRNWPGEDCSTKRMLQKKVATV